METEKPPFAPVTARTIRLIDDLSFLLNSLPPYNGSVSLKGSAAFAGSDYSRRASRRPAPIYAPQGVQPNAKTPTVQEWNFTVEQQLSHDTVLRVAYVGSFGYHGLLSVDPNAIPAQICSNCGGCSAGGNGASLRGIRRQQGAQYIPASGARCRIPIWARDSSGTPKATAATTRCKWT